MLTSSIERDVSNSNCLYIYDHIQKWFTIQICRRRVTTFGRRVSSLAGGEKRDSEETGLLETVATGGTASMTKPKTWYFLRRPSVRMCQCQWQPAYRVGHIEEAGLLKEKEKTKQSEQLPWNHHLGLVVSVDSCMNPKKSKVKHRVAEVGNLSDSAKMPRKNRQAPICYFRDKCLDFAHNCKFANLIQCKNYLFKDFIREQHLHVLQYLQKQRMVLTTRHHILAIRTLQADLAPVCIFLWCLHLPWTTLPDTGAGWPLCTSALFQALWQLRRLISC